jgi:hypothetical protein
MKTKESLNYLEAQPQAKAKVGHWEKLKLVGVATQLASEIKRWTLPKLKG